MVARLQVGQICMPMLPRVGVREHVAIMYHPTRLIRQAKPRRLHDVGCLAEVLRVSPPEVGLAPLRYAQWRQPASGYVGPQRSAVDLTQLKGM